MIEKLDLLKMFNERQTDAQWNKAVETTVNILIDAVNELQNRIDPPSVYQVMKDKDAIIGKHIDEKQRLQDELDHTKKQLEIANYTLRHADWFFDGDYNVYAKDMHKEIKYAIKAISDIADYGQPIQELDNE